MNNAEIKIQRMKAALSHHEPDRVPVGEFFWTGFIERCKAIWGDDFDAYRYFDLDYIVITPNLDPHIKSFDILYDKDGETVVKTGFEATIRRKALITMPHFEKFSINEPHEMNSFNFDDPADLRRYNSDGDDQLNGVGDALIRNIPSWNSRIEAYKNDFAIFGSVCEPYEFLWRIIGTENSLYWMAEEIPELEDFIRRIGAFLLSACAMQIKHGAGRLCGMYIWGDVAYKNGMLFSPEMWRKYFKPYVREIIRLCHQHNIQCVYHGCGNATAIYDDLIEIGLDAYNPLEAKAGLDVVELRKKYGEKISFVGNIDMRILESGDLNRIRHEVLYKLQAAQGGGWVFQSDHSVSSSVDPRSYEYAIRCLRNYGKYPLNINQLRVGL